MPVNQIKEILEENKENLAFIIGNGINRFPDNPESRSWDNLLMALWRQVSKRQLNYRPAGISTTEFYDVLELENNQHINLQESFCRLMADWKPGAHHKLITQKIKSFNAPLLTTNFEETIASAIDFKLFRTEKDGFTDFYPWTTYHGEKQLKSPEDGFGIWYINGMIKYSRSIRLGLTHYMGSVSRARDMMHKGHKRSLFNNKKQSHWKGQKTWLHVLFYKALFIFGLGLDENETFLRWLLIERSKYFRQFPRRKQSGWYLTKNTGDLRDEGKKFFLEKVGIKVIEVNRFEDIYESIWL
ncbi:MAG: hypothetical protein JXR46_16875 [Calditrichaceae bacterium]|nr:hypothetical protein [Calditrichaceae bacterium]MBN2710722.1 hypothetical protein [Calditrichaceae bacterium]RQV92751.1 MAG: hypothetical protein EH224_14560 [Calditrichota bacterium]